MTPNGCCTTYNSCFVSILIKNKNHGENTVYHTGAHSNALLFRTHLPMRFADGFLIFVSLSVHIPTRCCAFAVKPNINHSEYVFEIVRV